MGIELEVVDGPNLAFETSTIALESGAGTGTPGAAGSTNSSNPLGTIAGPVNIDASFTETTGDFTASFTATLTNFAEATPSNDFTFTVSGGGTPTITLSSTPAARFSTDQTLSLLVDGDYRAVFLYDGTNYDVYVDLVA